MGLRVAGDGDVFLLAGDVASGQRDDVAMVNGFLAHLKGRNFAASLLTESSTAASPGPFS